MGNIVQMAAPAKGLEFQMDMVAKEATILHAWARIQWSKGNKVEGWVDLTNNKIEFSDPDMKEHPKPPGDHWQRFDFKNVTVKIIVD